MKKNFPRTRTLFLEQFESRLPCATGIIVQQNLPHETVVPGQQDVVMSELEVFVHGASNATLRTLIGYTPPGVTLRDVHSFAIRQDRDRNGSYEALVQDNIRPVTGRVVRFHGLGIDGIGTREPARIQITADLNPNATVNHDLALMDVITQITAPDARYPRANRVVPTLVVGENPRHKIVLPVPIVELTVTELAGPANDTAVSNQNGLTFGRFRVNAANKDMLVTSAAFSAQQGTTFNANNWQLWVKMDGIDTLLQDNVVAINNRIDFHDFDFGGFVIEANQSADFFLVADASSSPSPNNITRMGLIDLQGEYLDNGMSLNPNQIDITTTPQTLWTFKQHEALTVQSMPLPRQDVLLGSQSDTGYQEQFTSQFGRSNVFYIGYKIEGDKSPIDRLRLFRAGESESFATASVAGSQDGDDFGVTLSYGDFFVGDGLQETLFVTADIRSQDNGGLAGKTFVIKRGNMFVLGDDSNSQYQPTVVGGNNGSPVRTVGAKVKLLEPVDTNANGTQLGTGVTIGARLRLTTEDNIAGSFHNAPDQFVGDSVTMDYFSSNVSYATAGFAMFNPIDPTVKLTTYRLQRFDGTPIPVTPTGTVMGDFQVVYTGLRSSGVVVNAGSNEQLSWYFQELTMNTKVNSALPSYQQARLRPSTINWYDVDAAMNLFLQGVDHSDVWFTRYVS